jgi:hypothetical protein
MVLKLVKCFTKWLVKWKKVWKTLFCSDINKLVALNFVLHPEKSNFKNQFLKL